MVKKKAKRSKSKNGNGATLGFEQTLWAAADKLRNNMDAAEYKHVVLGLIFLKYISDAFTELHDKLLAGGDEYEGADSAARNFDVIRCCAIIWARSDCPPDSGMVEGTLHYSQTALGTNWAISVRN